ncbi:hypothetical protein BYT27DRAFT_7190021 [Phlegmacium glaucopus]|nr:hypothetical protein BYT27DRAFT_7190021 [Phlegmacium glaucopus]
MATRTPGVLFINTVGLLYASLGFSLSVLAALFGIFNPFINPPRARSFHSRPHLPRKLRGPRTVRSFSDQSKKVTVHRPEHLSVERECTHDNVKALRRRSKSLIPVITIDHFGSTNSPDFLPKPVLHAETSPVNTDVTVMDLSTMSRPRIKRRSSSPLVLPRSTPLAVPSSHSDSLLVPSRKGSKSSFIKMSRKTPSAANINQETVCCSVHDEV